MNRIKDLREQKGWSAKTLAEKCAPRTSQQQIHRLEKGERQLTQSWLERLGAALDCEPWEILTAEKTSKPSALGEARQNSYAAPPADHPLAANPIPQQGDVFWVYVPDDTMAPRYFSGELVAVNPKQPVKKGNDCVVEYTDSATAIRVFEGNEKDKHVFSQYAPAKKTRVEKSKIKKISVIVGRG